MPTSSTPTIAASYIYDVIRWEFALTCLVMGKRVYVTAHASLSQTDNARKRRLFRWPSWYTSEYKVNLSQEIYFPNNTILMLMHRSDTNRHSHIIYAFHIIYKWLQSKGCAALLFMSLLPLLPHPIFDVSFNFVPALRYSASSHILQMPRGQRVFLIAPCEKKSNHLMCVPDWRLQANPKEKKNHNNENKRNHRRIISNALVHALSNRHRNVALYGEYETTEDWDNKR